MFDYLERISLKFHIEEFLQNNIQSPYRIKFIHIGLSQNNGLLHVNIADLRLLRNHKSLPYRKTVSFHIKDLNFEHLLNNVNWILSEFEQTRKEINK